MNDDMIRVPVLVDFDDRKIVGELIIRRDELPSLPDWHLALGYKRKIETPLGYELACVSITHDSKFRAEDQGVLDHIKGNE